MAVTTIPEALVRKAWAKDTWDTAMSTMFFSKFMGKSPNSIVQINEDLKKDAGDQVTTGLLMKLAGDGVTGDNTLEGNEEALIFRDFAITIDQIRNAVRTKGKMEEQKTPTDLKQKAKDALSVWLQEYTEKKIFSKLTNSPTSGRVVYAGTAKTEATLAATDKFTADLIGKARRIAIADKYAKIRPVSVDGKNLYVMIVDPWQARDLRSDAKWLAAQQSANIRGETNPIFTGALGMYEGVVVHENELIPRTATGASSAKVGHALFLGAQAAIMAVGKEPTWEEDTFDYGNQIGVAYGRIFGIEKAQFKFDGENLTDFGCINVLTASADD